MKITKNELRKLIYEELNKSSIENPFTQKVINDEVVLDLNSPIQESFDTIEDQNLIKESEEKIEEIKTINEEIKRMKQLVDFRSPLLLDNNL